VSVPGRGMSDVIPSYDITNQVHATILPNLNSVPEYRLPRL
ncbi:MAG: hypothetical protein QOE50_1471, partial [Sphingomonadales bacterium]|nr:hypothetical protein [Sphingomonadales bacterium]